MRESHKASIYCIPPRSTHQAALQVFKTAGRHFIGRSKKGRQVDKELQALLRPCAPPTPYEVPLHLCVRWVYPYLKSEPKKNRSRPIPCGKRPDADNLIKGLLDAMGKAGWFKDDGLVYRLDFQKLYAEKSGIFLEAYPVG